MRPSCLIAFALLGAGCGATQSASTSPLPVSDAEAPADVQPPSQPTFVAPSAQRTGNPGAGYSALVNRGYVGCGIPAGLFQGVFGNATATERIPGRDAANANLPFNYTRFTTSSGVDVVGPNCLQCHAAPLMGKVVVGLGNASADFTVDRSQQFSQAVGLLNDPKDRAELTKLAARFAAIGPYSVTNTVGVNPADSFTAVLFAHRDRKTLAWSDAPLMALPPPIVLPVDVPPWWRMSKKNAMFYTGAGRGDHARIMMTASTLCIDSVDEAKAIDAYFTDVRAYISSLSPPAYPFAVDKTLADRGRTTFESVCARCHGTYGAAPSYPNLLIPIDAVATDAELVSGMTQYSDVYEQWYNESFYGEVSRLESQRGYYAPPLDGIWATAPYLHNGSVPSVMALLDSKSRPKFWTRTFDSNDYDERTLGWKTTVLEGGKDSVSGAREKSRIYDTTLHGYSNTGHTYGDGLSDDERAAVVEYLKTL